MGELLWLLVGASPLEALLGFTYLAVIVLLVRILAPILRLDAKAWFLCRRGVSKKEVAEWAIAEAKRDRPDPLVEIINALRQQRDGGES